MLSVLQYKRAQKKVLCYITVYSFWLLVAYIGEADSLEFMWGWGGVRGRGLPEKTTDTVSQKKDQPGLQEEELLQNLVNDDN